MMAIKSTVIWVAIVGVFAQAAWAQTKADKYKPQASPEQAARIQKAISERLYQQSVVLNCSALYPKTHKHFKTNWELRRKELAADIAYALGPKHGVTFLKNSRYRRLMRTEVQFSNIIALCEEQNQKRAAEALANMHLLRLISEIHSKKKKN